MPPAGASLDALDLWKGIRAAFTHRYLGLREDVAVPVEGRRPRALPPPSVVGSWGGRTWEVGFQPPRTLYPDTLLGLTTATRLVPPERMPTEPIPWVYAGERPGVFSKNAYDFDRIIMRYRRREGSFTGTLTGDAELDRRWAIYPYDDALSGVFREPDVLATLRTSAGLSPKPGRVLPTLAVYGTEATFTLPLAPQGVDAGAVTATFEGVGHILDRLEEARGLPAARDRPIEMDVLRDERGVPFPVPRFACPICGESTHPRYQANLESEVCAKCGKLLYRWK